MNAWGTKVFEDDAYLDWFDEFCLQNSPIELIRTALTEIMNNDEFLDSESCAAALAAAEILAAAIGRPSDDFPSGDYYDGDDEKDAIPQPDLAKIKKKVSPALLAKAYEVVEKIQDSEQSALRNEWAETDELEDWLSDLDELKLRLSPEIDED